MKPKFLQTLIAMVLCGLLISACNPTAPAAGQDKTLKIALLPILDVLPFYVAQDRGYFEAEGLNIELVPIKSAQERDALLQAGETDGALTDLQGVALFNREASDLKVIYKARKAYPNFPHFRLVAAPGFVVNGPADMANVPVGISQNTIIEYLNDRLLTAWGLPADQLAIEEVSAIPVRFELLMAGQLKAALLPDPQAQSAIAAGASLIVDDTQFPQYSQSVLAFTTTSIEQKPETIRAFLKAWNKAVTDINQNPNTYRNVLIEKTRVPPNIQDTYNIPQFPLNELTTEAEWRDVVAWMQQKGLLDQPVPYAQAVDATFVP